MRSLKKKIRLLYRLFYFILCVSILVIFSTVSEFFIKNKVKHQKKVSKLIQFLSQKLMKSLGFKITVEGQKHIQKDKNYLFVANHVSYTDITLIHSFICNNRFITHYEWRESSPFLDLISRKAKVYFIERRNLKNIRKELRDTIDILQKGLHLVFFPEGTSTDGSKILSFHPLFFSTAIQAKKSVLPIYINYKKIENQDINSKNKDLVYWYDHTLSFAKHLLRLAQLKSIEVHIKILPPISSKGKNSRELAEQSREKIVREKEKS